MVGRPISADQQRWTMFGGVGRRFRPDEMVLDSLSASDAPSFIVEVGSITRTVSLDSSAVVTFGKSEPTIRGAIATVSGRADGDYRVVVTDADTGQELRTQTVTVACADPPDGTYAWQVQGGESGEVTVDC